MGPKRSSRTRPLVLAIVLTIVASKRSLALYDGNEFQLNVLEPTYVAWVDTSFPYPNYPSIVNIYTGDLQVLRDTGVYTQSSSSTAPLPRTCFLFGTTWSHFDDTPLPGQCFFVLLSGAYLGSGGYEGGLGTDGQGRWRSNTQPCGVLLDPFPPAPPGPPTLVPGHCGGFLASWTPSSSEDVAGYLANIGTAPQAPFLARTLGSSPGYFDGLENGTSYYVSMRAQDGSGNYSTPSPEVSATTTDTTTPSQPTTASAVPSVHGVGISWSPVVTNVEDVPGDPASPMIRDLAGYRVYRGNEPNVLASRMPYANETEVTGPPWYDTGAVNCHNYYYAITAVDKCGVESVPTPAFRAYASTSIAPEAPANVQALVLEHSRVVVSWDPVTKDVAGNDIAIGAYDVYRSKDRPYGDPSPPSFPLTPVGTATSTTYVDLTPSTPDQLDRVFYAIKAKDECVNESAASSPVQARCAFSGSVELSLVNGAVVAGVTPVTVYVNGGTDTYTGVTITYTTAAGDLTRTFAATTTGTFWTDIWLANPPGAYSITATITSSNGCTASKTITVNAGSAVGCCLSMFPTTNTIASCAGGATKCKEVSYRIGNNQCLTAVGLLGMTVSWVDYSNNHPRWVNARFNGTNIAAVGSWTATYVGATNEVGTVTKTGGFATPTPQVPYATPMTSGNTTIVTYVFDQQTASVSGPTRFADVFTTNRFVFTLLDGAGIPTGITTTCNMPALTVN